MGATFVITLREAFEASLILGIVYTYLEKIGARDSYRYVTWGGGLGLLMSVGMGIGVGYLSGPLLDLGPDLVGAAVIFAAVGLLTWHAWWMQQHARAIRGQVQHRIDEARAAQRFWMVGLIAFTGVFREGAETVLFLWGIMAQAASTDGWGSLLGGVTGVATAAAVGWAIFHGGKHLSLSKFFSVTTVFIMLLAAGLFSTGIGRLQGLGVLPLGDPLWDTSALLSDRTVLGGFLSGLVGYRARPSALEVIGYVAYLATAAGLLWGRGSRSDGRQRQTPISAARQSDSGPTVSVAATPAPAVRETDSTPRGPANSS
jgi:high-affinity iron transporter